MSQASYWVGDGDFADFALELTPAGATLWLTRKPTNVALNDATLTLENSEGTEVAQFKPTGKMGVYTSAAFANDDFSGHLSLQAGDESDLIELTAPAYKLEAIRLVSSATVQTNSIPWPIAAGTGATGALLLAALVQLLLRRVRRKNLATTAVLFSAIAVAAWPTKDASAHAGHDHDGPPEANQSFDGSIVLAKKSQLLIGLRTAAIKKEDVAGALRTYGHILPKPQNDAVLLAPQPGFVRVAPGIGPGSKVRRGDRLATIQSLNPITIEAPIDGEIAEMTIVDGGRLEAGARVARIVDASVLWVDAKLFPAQLTIAKSAQSARVIVDGAQEPINAHALGITTSVDEATRLGRVYLELESPPPSLRIGSLATIVFPLATHTEGWRLPASAVLRRGGDMVAYVQTGPETFAVRVVAVAESPEPGEVLVTSGLENDSRVVVQGNYQLMMSAR